MSHLAYNPTNGHLIWHSASGHLCYKRYEIIRYVPCPEQCACLAEIFVEDDAGFILVEHDGVRCWYEKEGTIGTEATHTAIDYADQCPYIRPGDCPEVPASEKVEMQIVSLTGVIWFHDAQIVSWPDHELPPPGSKDWTYFIPSMFPFSLPYQADCVWLSYPRRLELIDNTYWKLTFGSGISWSYRVLFEARKYSGNSPVGTYTVVESSRQYPYGADYGISHTVNNIVIAKA